MTTVQPQKAGYGAAGRRGEGVRADLWVGVELREQGGVELALESRVAAYYGDSIRQQVYDLLLTLGVSDARVELQDHGALPFVIAARIEAAVLRAGVTPAADARPAARKPSGVGFVRSCLRRSRLYLPGNQPQYFVNAGLHRSDAVILDLEDSVHLAEKDAARLLVRNALRVVDFRNAERMVRINQLPLGLADLEAIVPEKPEVIVIPKTETADQVRGVAEIVDRLLGASATLRLIPILETALGVENCFEIATSSDRIAALTIGLEDYAADLGVARSTDGVESDFARRRLVNAAKAAGGPSSGFRVCRFRRPQRPAKLGGELAAARLRGAGLSTSAADRAGQCGVHSDNNRNQPRATHRRSLRSGHGRRIGCRQPGVEDDRSAGSFPS